MRCTDDSCVLIKKLDSEVAASKETVRDQQDQQQCLNVKPYLGKDENRVESVGTHVVVMLMETYSGRW